MMQMIPEALIEKVAVQLEEANQYEAAMEAFTRQQPMLASFLLSESFDLLTAGERDLMLYLALVVWKSVDTQHAERPVVSEEQIGEAEERGWEMLQATTSKTFRDRLDPFFADTTQEDLLAFVEDALSIDDEEEENPFELTKEGREPIFVALHALIESLTI